LPEGGQGNKGLDEGFLQGIFGIGSVPQHPAEEAKGFLAVSPDEDAEIVPASVQYRCNYFEISFVFHAV
jgi:hypothetical protein